MTSSLGYTPGASSYKFQTPDDQSQQAPPGWQPPTPDWGHYPPGQYPSYGMSHPQSGSGGWEALATMTLLTGISAIAALLVSVLLVISATNSFLPDEGLATLSGILLLLSFIGGATAIFMGIIAVSMSRQNPAISRAKAIVGICLGSLPLLLLLIGLLAGVSFKRIF